MSRSTASRPSPARRPEDAGLPALGPQPHHPVPYGTEAGAFQKAGVPTVVCGPGSIDQAHQPDEFITLDALAQGEAFMRRLLDCARRTDEEDRGVTPSRSASPRRRPCRRNCEAMAARSAPSQSRRTGPLGRTGSFDQSVILWRLAEGAADAVLRFHEARSTRSSPLPDGRFASAGEDGRVILWRQGRAEPEQVIGPLGAAVNALALSRDGGPPRGRSARRRRQRDRAGDGRETRFPVPGGPVNGVAFLPSGELVATNAAGTLQVFAAPDNPRITLSGFISPGAVVAAPDGEIVFAAADGKLRFVRDGQVAGEVAVGETPLVAVALSADGALIAAGGIRGQAAIIERASRTSAPI